MGQAGICVRNKKKVVTEKSGAYRSATRSARMEVTAVTETLRWSSDRNVTGTIIVTNYQSVKSSDCKSLKWPYFAKWGSKAQIVITYRVW